MRGGKGVCNHVGTTNDLSVLCLVGMDSNRDEGHSGVSPAGHKVDSEGSGALDRSWTDSGAPPGWQLRGQWNPAQGGVTVGLAFSGLLPKRGLTETQHCQLSTVVSSVLQKTYSKSI